MLQNKSMGQQYYSTVWVWIDISLSLLKQLMGRPHLNLHESFIYKYDWAIGYYSKW